MALVCLYLVSISADAVAAWVAATKWDKINPTVLYPFVVCAAQQQTVDNTIYNDGINVSPPILIFSVFKRVYSTCVRARAHHVYESSLSSHGLAIEIPWPPVGWSLRVFFFNPTKMKRRNSFFIWWARNFDIYFMLATTTARKIIVCSNLCTAWIFFKLADG
jgi:hypothetical protein